MEVEGLLENIYFNLLSEWERYGGREIEWWILEWTGSQGNSNGWSLAVCYARIPADGLAVYKSRDYSDYLGAKGIFRIKS